MVSLVGGHVVVGWRLDTVEPLVLGRCHAARLAMKHTTVKQSIGKALDRRSNQ